MATKLSSVFSEHKLLVILFVLSALIVIVAVFWPKGTVSKYFETDVEGFARCLKEQGLVMYGSDICEECQNQKKMFDEAFKEIKYVNCDFHRKECQAKGIFFYPVWMKEQKSLRGVQSFPQLAAFSGCTKK